MKKCVAGFCFLFLLTAGAVSAQDKVIYDENASPRAVQAFRSIIVSSHVMVYISQSTEYGLAVSASDAKKISLIHTSVKDSVLTISGYGGSKNVARVYLSVVDLDKIEVSGLSSVVLLDAIKSKRLKIKLTGNSELRGGVAVDELLLQQSGSSDSHLQGAAGRIVLSLSGASDCRSYGLVCDYADIETSGASDVELTINKVLNARASGASDIRYVGFAKEEDVRVSGASSVERKVSGGGVRL